MEESEIEERFIENSSFKESINVVESSPTFQEQREGLQRHVNVSWYKLCRESEQPEVEVNNDVIERVEEIEERVREE